MSRTEKQKIAAMLGIEIPSEPTPAEDPIDIAQEGEAALLYAEGTAVFIRKNCKTCGLIFAHTPGAVAYCSNECRARALADIGIDWDYTKDANKRWKKLEALVVPPEAVYLIDELTDVRDHLKCPVHNHMRDTSQHGAWCWEQPDSPPEEPDSPAPAPAAPAAVPPEASLGGLDDATLDVLKDLGLD